MALYYPGEIIADRYRVERELGEGGFGSVYEATEFGMERRVAVKVLKPDAGRGYQPSTRARFEREAHAVGHLQSPHTVALLDFGESEGKLFMVFELVPGEDLRAIINRDGRLDPNDAVHILRQLLDSLGEAHRAGILHRDIKPANIRVFPLGDSPLCVKLLDFGLARPTDHGSPGITATGVMVGTPRYMSPEQLSVKPLTAASDIYSLGVVFLEMLVGPGPLQGSHLGDQLSRMVAGHVFDMPELWEISPELVAVMHRMTARDPDDRFQTAHAVLTALNPGRSAPVANVAAAIPWPAVGVLVALTVLGAMAAVLALKSGDAPVEAAGDEVRSRREVSKPPAAAVPAPQLSGAMDSGPNDPHDHGDSGDAGNAGDSGCGQSGVGSQWIDEERGILEIGQDPNIPRGQVYVPQSYDPEVLHPVVVVLPRDVGNKQGRSLSFGIHPLHDGKTPINEHRRSFVEETGFPELADTHGFVLVIPPAQLRWEGTDDVEATFDHLESVHANLCTDRQRVFVVGDYDGGHLAYRLSTEEWVTAIAVWAFLPEVDGMPTWPPERPPKPIIYLMPTNSVRAPLDAPRREDCWDGESGFGTWEKRWQARNGCSAVRRPLPMTGGHCVRFGNCEAPLQTCEVRGGYEWPNTTSTKRDKRKCGSEDWAEVDLTTTIWKFFEGIEPIP